MDWVNGFGTRDMEMDVSQGVKKLNVASFCRYSAFLMLVLTCSPLVHGQNTGATRTSDPYRRVRNSGARRRASTIREGLEATPALAEMNALLGFPPPPVDQESLVVPRSLLGPPPSLWQRIVDDHLHYYDGTSLRMLAGGFLAGAAVANTQLDQEIHDHFQASVRNATSDEWFEFLHANKELGNGVYTLPVFAGAWAVGSLFDEQTWMGTASHWGERSMRSFLVGAPPLMLAQRMTGGSRPGELGRESSHWNFWADNNGVSGHAFMSSLPFINAAKMTDHPVWKTTFYAGSLLGPLSRVNDNAHFPSQVALGWWMSYLAATAVDRTELANESFHIYPMISPNQIGAMFEFTY